VQASGEAVDSEVAVLPAAACETYWARDPRPVLESFVEHAGRPYAVVQAPRTQVVTTHWAAIQYIVVFESRSDSFVDGVALYLTDTSIVAVQVGCNTPTGRRQ